MKISAALVTGTLQAARADALAREQFDVDAESAYQDTLRTNKAYGSADVKTYIIARVRGGQPTRPLPVPFDPSKPMADA